MKSVGFILLAAVMMLFAAPAFSASAAAETTGGSSDPAIAGFETSTLGAMIDSTVAENQLAQLCLDRASRDDTRAFCQANLVQTQAWLDSLKGWLGTWYGNTTYSGNPGAEDAAMLDQLKNTPDDQFEGALLEAWSGFNSRASSVATNYLASECSDGRSSHRRGADDSSDCGAARQLNPSLMAAGSSMIDYYTASD